MNTIQNFLSLSYTKCQSSLGNSAIDAKMLSMIIAVLLLIRVITMFFNNWKNTRRKGLFVIYLII